jgi:competence protein ComEC
MFSLFVLGAVIRRRTNIFIVLATACLVILLWNPYQLFDAGFQLSFVTVLGIALITPRIEEIFNMQKHWKIILNNKLRVAGSLKLFFISAAAWLSSTALAAYHFGYISWIGPFSNLIFIPLVTLILTSGFILLIFAFLCPFLAVYFAGVVNFLLFLLLKISEIMSAWNFVHTELPPFHISLVFIYYLMLIALLFYPKLKKGCR